MGSYEQIKYYVVVPMMVILVLATGVMCILTSRARRAKERQDATLVDALNRRSEDFELLGECLDRFGDSVGHASEVAGQLAVAIETSPWPPSSEDK